MFVNKFHNLDISSLSNINVKIKLKITSIITIFNYLYIVIVKVITFYIIITFLINSLSHTH